jgi:N-acetylneuraminic acid mutarotase
MIRRLSLSVLLCAPLLVCGSGALAAVADLPDSERGARPARADERERVHARSRGVERAVFRSLSLEQRVEYQRRIEEVYWRHRIWPKENLGAKPALRSVVSDASIRAKVEDTLKKSNALETIWGRPITAEQLQAELDRLVSKTRNAALLQDVFAALDDDPFVIAETLARHTLADRLIRDRYAFDDRFHGEITAAARSALETCDNAGCIKTLGDRYVETTWRLRADADGGDPAASNPEDDSVTLDPDQWEAHLARLASKIGGTPDAIPIGTLSPAQETADGIEVTTLLARDGNRVTTAAAIWQKLPFDRWWTVERAGQETRSDPMPAKFRLGALQENGCTPETWLVTAPPAVPDPREAHTAIFTGSEMIVWGGYSGDGLDTGGRYDPATDTWTLLPAVGNSPERRRRHTAVWTGTEMVVWGGESFVGGEWIAVNTGGRYDPVAGTWTATSTGANVSNPRAGHTAVWTGTEMIVWGGVQGVLSLNSGGRYNPSTDAWTVMATPTNVAPRDRHTAVWTGTEMIVWGGVLGGSSLNSGGRYNPANNSWSQTTLAGSNPGPRRNHTAVWTGTVMIVWGGFSGNVRWNTGGRYDPVTNSWAETSAVGAGVPTPRESHTAVWTGTRMIVWGGFSGSTPLDSGGIYNPATNSWVETSTTTNVPARRTNHTAVWTGTDMIVWGGATGTVPDVQALNTGGRYNPTSNSWVATAMDSNVPTARDRHTALWTGAEMIVWGGRSGSEVNTGGRYDPATDSWTATARGGDVPAERESHTAVWTGTEMVVWGGFRGGSWLNTGGRYNPATDSWAQTSIAGNVPDGPRRHTAVWTGTEMIVWGGSLTTNTGGRYNPTTDTWLPTSTGANVPAPRAFHTAVWTGREMIVWGGSSATGRVNTGGRYDPGTDTWSETPTGANVPEARDLHTAVWTGREMIVWGGSSDSALRNTGGRYDRASNSWLPTSIASNVPTARQSHTALWTGTEMVVWGGWSGAVADTGGVYDPAADSWVATSTGSGVPAPRYSHTTVWTGAEMIAWGGFPLTATGGSYCVPRSDAPALVCSTLGDQPVGDAVDQDVWTFEGGEGEAVSISLVRNDDPTGRADLVLVDDMGGAVDLFLIDRTALPNEVRATLPADGTYRIAVIEHHPALLLPGKPFLGDYCLTIDGDEELVETLSPTESVENANGAR